MNNTIQYKGYVGSIEFSDEDMVFCGKVLGIRSLISYEGETAKELVADFHGAVDDYLNTCNSEGIKPEKPFKGTFNVRLSPELHQNIAICAQHCNISLNNLVKDILSAFVNANPDLLK